MTDSSGLGRRTFLKLGMTAALAAGGLATGAQAALIKPAAEPFAGLKMGIASYTFRKLTLDQALAATQRLGLKYINLKDVHLPLNSTPEQCEEARKKIAAAGLTLMGGGVIYFKNDPEPARKIFEYARQAGMPTIVCSPDVDALDLAEKLAREFDLRVAIHNHGPTDRKYPSPLDVLELVKNRDSRLGICMDVGHTVRIKQDPVTIIEQCQSRLYDFHMKDETRAQADGEPIEMGRGVIDVAGVLRALVGIKFGGHVGLEYEAHPEDPLPGASESIGYMRGILTKNA